MSVIRRLLDRLLRRTVPAGAPIGRRRGDDGGGASVREPRRPKPTPIAGAAALPEPHENEPV